MSNNQEHGIKFERYIKKLFDYDQIDFDIPLHCGNEGDYPISIKAVKQSKNIEKSTICLASAPEFWRNNQAFKLVVGLYEQNGSFKKFNFIYEFTIDKGAICKLTQPYIYKDINDLEQTISKFEHGKDGQKAARLFCKNNKILSENKSIIKLNPKIDSKTQRRLQCSITLEKLSKIIKPSIHKDFYKNGSVNIKFRSSSREFTR